jgi:hypothetical protein
MHAACYGIGEANPIELTNNNYQPCVFSSLWTADKILPIELTKYKLQSRAKTFIQSEALGEQECSSFLPPTVNNITATL